MSDFLDNRTRLNEDEEPNFLKRDPMDEPHLLSREIPREPLDLLDSTEDFEHLEHELEQQQQRNQFQQPAQPLLDFSDVTQNLLDTSVPSALLTDLPEEVKPVPKTPPPSAESIQTLSNNGFENDVYYDEDDRPEFDNDEILRFTKDPKTASMAFVESEKNNAGTGFFDTRSEESSPISVVSSSLPQPEKSPEVDFLKDEILVQEATAIKEPSWNVIDEPPTKPLPPKEPSWNVIDEPPTKPLPPKEPSWNIIDEPPTKPLPPVPPHQNLYNDDLQKQHQSGTDTGDSEFESEPEPSPARQPITIPKKVIADVTERKQTVPKKNSELLTSDLLKNISLGAWFNPERLHPKVAALIYWRDPKKSGVVFAGILAVLLSLAYFSLISVIAYVSLLTLLGTIGFRIYKTVLQAVQKTSDGHPFKEILDIDLSLPSEKVHDIADIAVSNINGALTELRRLFLVEDFIDSLKFGVILWSLTYLGAWFNGMTLVIIGVVALFTLPKVYETNKTQIDKNLAQIQDKINEITSKVKSAVPIGKKDESKKDN